MKLNYFSNFMLKHLPSEFDEEMLKLQDDYLQKLEDGKTIWISSELISMKKGKIFIEINNE